MYNSSAICTFLYKYQNKCTIFWYFSCHPFHTVKCRFWTSPIILNHIYWSFKRDLHFPPWKWLYLLKSRLNSNQPFSAHSHPHSPYVYFLHNNSETKSESDPGFGNLPHSLLKLVCLLKHPSKNVTCDQTPGCQTLSLVRLWRYSTQYPSRRTLATKTTTTTRTEQ